MATTMVVRGAEFKTAERVNRSLTAAAEKRLLCWLAERLPSWVTSDGLTILGLAAQVGAGACFALARWHRVALVGVCGCVVLNWLGDSLDGTVARVRGQQRPRYGFYVDHVVDVLGAVALMGGLACSGVVHAWVAAESYLATYTLGRFEMSQGMFGPTEVRLLLIAGTLALLRSPWATIAGHRWLLFDVGGVIAAAGMVVMAVVTVAQHTRALYSAEQLPAVEGLR
jgi:phosphatidylglycerophosphate synthase